MKAPQVNSLEDAVLLASIIRTTIGVSRWAWSAHFVKDMYRNGSFNDFIRDEWRDTWTDDQCAAIAVAYRLSK